MTGNTNRNLKHLREGLSLLYIAEQTLKVGNAFLGSTHQEETATLSVKSTYLTRALDKDHKISKGRNC